MMIIRPAEERDTSELTRLSQTMGPGLTSLPCDAISWSRKIEQSLTSFAAQTPSGAETYLFVLEDRAKGRLAGTAQIFAKTAGSTQGYYYRVEKITVPKSRLQGSREIPILRPVRVDPTTTEIGGLFLDPTVRRHGLSKLVSLSRFLFIGAFPKRFQNKVIAEIRGHLETDGSSPFWNAIGRHFIDMPFDDIMQELMANPSFLSQVIPTYPIYVPLLSPEAQATVGKAHKLSEIALKRLLEDGFSHTPDIDLFGGGPKVAANTTEIATIKMQKLATVKGFKEFGNDAPQHLVSNDKLAFRAMLSPIELTPSGDIMLSKDPGQALQVNVGDRVHFV